MMLPDVNVLVALTNPAHQHHHQAHHWLRGVRSFATTPVTESGLVRLLLNRAVTGQQVTLATALGLLRGIREDPRATFLPDDSSLSDPHIDLVGFAGHRQTTDLHLVNLAARHGASLATFDRRLRDVLVPADQRHVHAI